MIGPAIAALLLSGAPMVRAESPSPLIEPAREGNEVDEDDETESPEFEEPDEAQTEQPDEDETENPGEATEEVDEDEAQERDDPSPARPRLGIEADLESQVERASGETEGEVTFDEVGFSLDGGWLRAEAGIKYQSESDRLRVEGAALRAGGTERRPWFLEAGRIILPFGEYESRFAEDPMTVMGETDENAVICGYERETIEAALGAFRGEMAGDGDAEFAASTKAALSEDWRAGASFTTDVSEAVELRELSDEFRESELERGGAAPPDLRKSIPAVGALLAWQRGKFAGEAEYIAALRSASSWLDRVERKPSAWSMEAAWRFHPRWEAAARLDASSDLPDAPERQFGVATSWTLSRWVIATVEILRGEFASSVPARDLFGLTLAFEY